MMPRKKKKDAADDVVDVISVTRLLNDDDEEEDDFSSRLSEEMKKELGEININWFEDAILLTSSSVQCKNLDETIQENKKIVSPEWICSSQKEELQLKSPDSIASTLPPFVFRWSPDTQICERSQDDCVHSTPAHITLSLGASMGGHDMSWTSSMATPVTYPNVARPKTDKQECLEGDSFDMTTSFSERSCDLAGQSCSKAFGNDSDVSLVIGVESEYKVKTKCNSLRRESLCSPHEDESGGLSKSSEVDTMQTELVEPEFKMPAETLKPSKDNSEKDRIPSCFAKRCPTVEGNRTPKDGGSDVCCGLGVSTTPTIKKSGLSRRSLPRKRMAELSSNIADKVNDARTVVLIDELRKDLRDEFMKDFDCHLKKNSICELEMDSTKECGKNPSDEFSKIFSDEFSKHPFNEFSNDPIEKVEDHSIKLENDLATFSIEAVDNTLEKSLMSKSDETDMLLLPPSVNQGSLSSIDVHQKIQQCQTILEDAIGQTKGCLPLASQSLLNMELQCDDVSFDVGVVKISNHTKQVVAITNEENIFSAINILKAEHDYAKPTMLNPFLSHVDESFSQGDSQQLNGVSELMEVVDCTTACLESIRHDLLQNNVRHDIPSKSEAKKEDTTRSRDESSNRNVIVSSGVGEFKQSEVTTKLKNKCSIVQEGDTEPIEVKDSCFWDPDFPESELVFTPMKFNTKSEQLQHSYSLPPDVNEEHSPVPAEKLAIEDSTLLLKKVSCSSESMDPIFESLFQKYEHENEKSVEGSSKIELASHTQLQLDAKVTTISKDVYQSAKVQYGTEPDRLSNEFTHVSTEQLNIAFGENVSKNILGATFVKKLIPNDLNKFNKESNTSMKRPIGVKKPNEVDSAVKNMLEPSPSHLTSGVKPMFPGFATASGKVVEVSESAIIQAKRRLQEDFTSLMDTSDGFAQNVKPQGFQGFSLASGKAVTLPAKALEKAKRLHNQILGDIIKEDFLRPTENSTKFELDNREKSFQGFSTASGKMCMISKDALENARIFFETNLSNMPTTDDLVFGTSKLRPDGDGHGVKRRFSSSHEQLDERPSKVLLRDDSAGMCAEEISVAANLNVTDTIDVSRDSLDAAEALIAMSNAACWSKPFSKVNCEKLADSSEDVHNVDATMSEWSSIDLCDNIPAAEEEEDHLHDSSRGMTTEVLESTFAFLEDELQDDLSKSGKSFQTRQSSALNCKGTPVQGNKCSESLNTPVPQQSQFEINCNGVVNEDSTTLRASDPVIVRLMANMSDTRKGVIQEQLARISQKSKGSTSPQIGVLYHLKTNNKNSRTKLREFFEGVPKSQPFSQAWKWGLKRSTLNVRSRNAKEFRFLYPEYFTEFSLVDGIIELEPSANLILDEQNSAGMEEFYRTLMDYPGVDPTLVSKEWVANHYRWIVWKLAAMEVSFAQKCGGRVLTPTRVFQELRYRVNCEIDYSRRSTLKKIAERDDTPLKTMVLCVADIIHSDPKALDHRGKTLPSDTVHLELTDGWYSMKALLDEPLVYLVTRGKISVGHKIVIHGAEIIGGTEACPPLEVPANQFLKLSYNCCRRARWDTRLGYAFCPRPFPLSLDSFRPDGGLIGLVDVVVARVYPLQFLEKRSDGTSFVCSDKVNELANQRAEVEKNAFMSKFYLEAESRLRMDELSQVKKQRFSLIMKRFTADEISALSSGEELADALRLAADPGFFESCLTSVQKESLVRYSLQSKETRQAHFQEELFKVMQTKQDQEDSHFAMERNVVSFLKVRLAGVHPKDVIEKTTALMTIWRPSEELIGLLEEGKCMHIYYLMAERRSNGKELLVKSSKMTQFEENSNVASNVLTEIYQPREFCPLDEIASLSFQPLYGEVDLVGVVLSMSNTCQLQRGTFEIVYLANANCDIVGIKFWGGVKAFGLEAVVEPASFVAGCNLQWRGRDKSPIPCVHMLEISTLTRNPKSQYGKRLLNDLRGSIKDLKMFVETAKNKIANYSVPPLVAPLNWLGQKTLCSTPIYNWRPPFKSVNCTTLKDDDFPRGICKTDSCDTSHQKTDLTLLKLRSLQRYVGSPPQLPVLASPNSSSVGSKYRVPRAQIVEPSPK